MGGGGRTCILDRSLLKCGIFIFIEQKFGILFLSFLLLLFLLVSRLGLARYHSIRGSENLPDWIRTNT